eukprot:GEZU01025480.1.p1 GENE.GEZU01025480.1~~GEZU01025480.1.p1  ORF type:complete len:113 (+),score=31.42 GEZU01025480.1:28-339(+)
MASTTPQINGNLPVEHIVLFKLRKDITEEQFNDLKKDALELKNKIDGIEAITFGKNITFGRDQGYTHGLRVLFTNYDACKKYGPHPDHQAFVKSMYNATTTFL